MSKKNHHLTLDTPVRVSDRILFTNVGQETVLLNTHTGTYFGLDELGTSFWSLISKNTSPRPAYEQILAEYDVAPQQLEKDLLELVSQLEKHGLLEIIPG